MQVPKSAILLTRPEPQWLYHPTFAEKNKGRTVNAAELLSWQDRVGAIKAGKYVDLIAVDGDPVPDIAVLRQVKFVMKDETVVKDMLTH